MNTAIHPAADWKPYHNRLRFRQSDLEKIPANAYGVYGLWFGRRCLYVGQAKKQPIAARLSQHWKGTHNQALAAWVKAKGGELTVSYFVAERRSVIDDLEKMYIRQFQPLTNKTLK